MSIDQLVASSKNIATQCGGTFMKALVYHGPGKRAWEDKPRPTILEPSDAIV